MAEELEAPVELTDEQLAEEKQKIRDGVNNPVSTDDVNLPSDNLDDKKYAEVYESIDELKKGIQNLGSTLPDYVLNGMNDEALEQYYIDLRKDFSSKPKEEPIKEEPKAEEPTPEKVEDTKKTIGEELWAELDAEFTKNGGLSDEYYNKLNDLGVPNTIVDGYLDGLRAKAVTFTNNIYELAGGEEQYNDIKAWAEDNYTQAELDMVAAGTQAEILFKMKAVKADYDSKNGSQRRIVGSSVQTKDGYADQNQYIMDVMSPEYRKNAKYKAKVDAKFQASSFGS